ncbi:hypothetical protein F3Y22_tig00112402pilonHSYRG00319 [Hibiscus syriacus]|uniref:Uncharacterized protein n=1 Tax=Hibiscus syriacus TaxID=106335 RepID=A0A6A2WZB7_HIBSY|nr:hypothetical protein F3Y22_tig00112402pilonHSYRG00319 [Hibiscus syriacus]
MADIILAILSFSTLCLIEAQNGGFSVELIHRDSIRSPLYNPSETTSDRATNGLRRSFDRVNHFKPTSVTTKSAEAEIIVNSGAYVMNISVGIRVLNNVCGHIFGRVAFITVADITDIIAEVILFGLNANLVLSVSSKKFHFSTPVNYPLTESLLAVQVNVTASKGALVLLIILANIQSLTVNHLFQMVILQPIHSPWLRQQVSPRLFLKQSSVVGRVLNSVRGHIFSRVAFIAVADITDVIAFTAGVAVVNFF